MDIKASEESVMIRVPMSSAVRQINHLFVEGTISGQTDGRLLERFLDGRDEAAFAALVERHGPMVFRTCQTVIRDRVSAEDAFQATFLVLVCKARTIRGREAIGGWLHRVAYRIAVQASADAAARRSRERLVGDPIVPDQARDDGSDDWRRIVHEEVARLSEKYRQPVLLCDLEGKTYAQAASELRWGEATVRRRRARAHDLLRSRLARRGVGLTVAGLAASSGRSAGAGLSSTCIQATLEAAAQMSTTAMRIAVAEVVSTAASALARKSLRAMLLGELKALASVAMVFCVLGCIAWGVASPGQAKRRLGGAMPRPRAVSSSPSVQSRTDKPDYFKDMIIYKGRVIDPDGRPFQGAELYLNTYGLKQVKNPPVRTTSGADGRFRFAVSRSDFDTSEVESPWSYSIVEARAKGYATGIANDRGDSKELSLQLARDDVPISGRIIDLEGRPVAGVRVKVLSIRSTANGSLDDWLKAIDQRKELYNLEHEFLPNCLEPQTIPSLIPDALTGVDGTFHIKGVGRERVATLQLEATTIETKQLEVRTRPGDTIRVPAYKGGMNPDVITIHGARFEHVAGPTRPIEGFVRDQDTGKPLAGMMVRGEHTLGNPIVYVHSITNADGHYRLVGLPRGREGNILAVPPCDFPVHGSRKAELKVPRDEELPYLPARVTIAETQRTGPVQLDIKMKRGVWVTGRAIDRATGKPVRAEIHYFAYLDSPTLKAFAGSRLPVQNYHFTRKDGIFTCVAFPGSGVLAARAYEDRYVFGAGVEDFKHKPEKGFLSTIPYYAIPTNYHVLAEIDPAEGTATLNRDLLLETGRSLTVTALGPDGKPLTDMKIAGLRDMAYWETPPSDASTHTIISLKPGKGRVLTFLTERKRLIGKLALRGDESGPQTVTLQPWGILTGRVVNGDGEPSGECQLNGIDLPKGYPQVGKDGRFRAEGLIPNQPYDLRILSKGSQLGGFIAKGLKVGPGETIDLHDVVPKNEGTE
jgi:RNA polymerase sigma factor (sigma-70 family)